MGKITVIENKLSINPDTSPGGWYVEEGREIKEDTKPDKYGKYLKKGDIVWEVVTAGYCTNIYNALNRCLNYKLAMLDDTNIEDFLKKVAIYQNELKQMLEI